VGITLHGPGSEVSTPDLLREAALAAGRAKASGGGRTRVFDEELRNEISRRGELETGLREALEQQQFELHYQPVLDLARGEVSSLEALIRWHRPGQGLVPPDEFIPVAEGSDLICDIGRWVLAEATRQLVTWRREGVLEDSVRVAVNLSGRHLAQPSVVSDVRTALEVSGLPANALVVEATETVVLESRAIHTNLERLRTLQVGLSLDDFGTGYTSIQQFRTLPVDTLKIDKSFLSSAGNEAEALVSLLVHSAHTFGLRVIAEGVEHREQVHLLRALGCDAAQGYHFSRPVPAGAVPTAVRAAAASASAVDVRVG
jgi:EAL domain-containing protein (putative c-di-GMP-specific phosphodiesterase class I)